MSDERFLQDKSGNGRHLKPVTGNFQEDIREEARHWLIQEAAGYMSERLVGQMKENGMLFGDLTPQEHASMTDFLGKTQIGPALDQEDADAIGHAISNVPAYEPLELVCGSYSASEHPQRYLVGDVRRWAAGDLADLHSTPRETIATLAEAVLLLLSSYTPLPVPRTFEECQKSGAWAHGQTILDQRVTATTATGMLVWVQLHERHIPAATEEEIAARLEGLRPWQFIFPERKLPWGEWPSPTTTLHDAMHLERWARGDQRDLHADAVTAMRGLAGEVLRLAGLEA